MGLNPRAPASTRSPDRCAGALSRPGKGARGSSDAGRGEGLCPHRGTHVGLCLALAPWQGPLLLPPRTALPASPDQRGFFACTLVSRPLDSVVPA